MRKIFIPVLTFLMLISFVSCNLDNDGILWRGQYYYPRDDKNRNYIGYSTVTKKIYYTTEDGLYEFDPVQESEKKLSSNDIFINNSPDIAWLTQNGDKIVYVDDYVEGYRNPKQDYWIYNLQPNDGEATLKEITDNINGLEAGYGLIDTFVNENDRYVVAQNGETIQLYTVSLDGETLNFTEKDNKINNYVDQMNGLIWNNPNGTELSFSYMGNPVSFKNGETTERFSYTDNDDNDGNQIKSVAVTSDIMVVLRYSDDDTVLVYKGNINATTPIELERIGRITEDLPNVTQSIIIDDENNEQKLIFVKYNGESSSSDLYIVDLNEKFEDTRYPHSTTIAGLNAEAFFTIEDNNAVYMVTKDTGIFRIDGTTVTPVPRPNY